MRILYESCGVDAFGTLLRSIMVNAAAAKGALVVLLVCVAVALEAPPVYKPGEANVRQLHAIFRHGARTPADTYPLDPYINETFSPFGWGQLTISGKRQVYEQGEWLRSHYHKFVGDDYSVVYAQSTDVDRSLMTAQIVLAAMFPPTSYQEIVPGLKWQPIPVHTTPLKYDNLLLVREPCPRYYEARDKVKTGAPYTELMERNAELLEKWTTLTGMPIDSLDEVQSLYSTLLAEKRFNLTLPEWTDEFFPHAFLNMTSYSFIVNVQTTLLQRLKAGPMLNKIVSDYNKVLAGKQKTKVFLYSGHDSTVANILVALGMYKPPYIPGYSSMVLLELLEPVPGQFTVRVYRRTEENVDAELMQIKGCDFECPLDKFMELTAPVRPADWHAECIAESEDFVPPPPPPP